MRLLPHSAVPCLGETAVLRPNPSSSTSWISEGFFFPAKGCESFQAWLWALCRCLRHPFPPPLIVSAMLEDVQGQSPLSPRSLPRSSLSHNSDPGWQKGVGERQKWHVLASVVSRSCTGALSHLWFSHMQVDTRHSWHTGAELAQGSRGVSHLHSYLLFKKRVG